MQNRSFKDVAEEANAIPIKEILENVAGCQFKSNGANLQCVSPLRVGGSKGSFSINVAKNTFHDWKMDICGGPVKFYMVYYNIGFSDAVKKIMNDWKLQSFVGRVSEKTEKEMLNQYKKKKQLNTRVLHAVYKIFLNALPPLDDEYKKLLYDRNFTDEDIKRIGFKKFPKRTKALREKIEKNVMAAGFEKEILYEIPGFYKVKDDPLFNFTANEGLIIPCRNIMNQIVGLQIRKKEADIDKKYIWFSSAFCLKNDPKNKYEQDGVGPGSPIGFVKGANPKWYKTMFVTEGFFKASAINRVYGMSSFTIQGVGNWKQIYSIIGSPFIKKTYPTLKKIIIAYDSDMCYNINVMKQAFKLGEAIQNIDHNMKVEYMLWKYSEDTKGIDDLIDKYGDIHNYVKKIGFKEFKEGYLSIAEKTDFNSSKEDVEKLYMKEIFNKI